MNEESAQMPECRQLQMLFDGLSEGVLVLGDSGAIVSANPAALRLHGVARVADLGATVAGYRRRFLLRDRNDRALPAEQDPIGRALAGETASEQVLTLHDAGHTVPLGTHRMRSIRLVGADGGDGFALLFGPAASRPQRKERAMAENETCFAAAFHLAPSPHLILDRAALRVLDVNEAFGSVFGYRPREVLDRSALRLGLLGGLGVRREVAQVLRETGCTRGQELRIPSRSGTAVDCLVSAEAITLRERPCLLLVAQDISARRRTETDLLDAIEAVMQDSSWFSRTVVEKMANIRASRSGACEGAELADLTLREKEVLGLICQGCSDKQIALELCLSAHTIRNHVAAIYAKLDVHKRGAAIVWAHERGFTGARVQ